MSAEKPTGQDHISDRILSVKDLDISRISAVINGTGNENTLVIRQDTDFTHVVNQTYGLEEHPGAGEHWFDCYKVNHCSGRVENMHSTKGWLAMVLMDKVLLINPDPNQPIRGIVLSSSGINPFEDSSLLDNTLQTAFQKATNALKR